MIGSLDIVSGPTMLRVRLQYRTAPVDTVSEDTAHAYEPTMSSDGSVHINEQRISTPCRRHISLHFAREEGF